MDKLRQKFVEEAFEHVSDIEQSLLKLENDPNDQDLIEKIFRAMHTLKGAGAMFGFDKVSELTHNLETVYDNVRNSKISFSKDIADLTLGSADYLKLLLNDSNEGVTDEEEFVKYIEKIKQYNTGSETEIIKKTSTIASSKENTYYIYFKPDTGIFDNGTNPLFLIDELANLGDCYSIPYLNEVPPVTELNPVICYTHWEIILSTAEKLSAVHDVFIFVEGKCILDIHQLAEGNLLANKKFLKKIEKCVEEGKDVGIDMMKILVNDIDQSVVNKLRKALGGDLKSVAKEYSISSIRVASEKLDQLMNMVSELVTTQARLSLFAEKDESSELTAISENIQKLSRQLRDLAFEIVLVPIETLITRFQRLVRDLSKELNKEVIFETRGTETELDKTIIENLTDPLMHIIRNCLDHGIEPVEERIKAGKPEQGTIFFNAYHSSTNVHIEIADDGRGIDIEKVRKKAIAKDLISEDSFTTDKQIFDLLFLPGFTTAENVTDVSGRGVGMDVVRQKISNIRGEIEIESQKNKGTKITLKIPLTLSIIDGLLVQVDETFYVIPLSSVQKIYAIDHNDIDNKFNNLIVLDGEKIPFFYLRKEFTTGINKNNSEQVIVIQYENQKVGLVVDDVIGEYQAVLKPLGKHYKKQEIISAATILGDGTIALVIDTNRAVTHFANLIYQEEKI
jgi:two-component system, chemotaxis family, sensor kinase CheA